MTNRGARLLALFCLLPLTSAAGGGWIYGRDRPDSWTNGGVWPLPQQLEYQADTVIVSPGKVTFNAGPHDGCDIIQDNIKRYQGRWLFPFPVQAITTAPEYTLTININTSCPTGVPQEEMNEKYTLKVSAIAAILEADEVWGAIRGLETFSQLIYYNETENAYKLRTAIVNDWPRFAVRGVLLDPSRHFLSVDTTKKELDIMAANKMNVLHWHLVDSESFTYTSAKFPDLSLKGAYSKRHVYSRDDIKGIINYARLRGIRVVPEFDTPGHTAAWIGQPNFLTKCYDEHGNEELQDLLDPSEEGTYTFLKDFFQEVVETFPEKMLHLGGDEVSFWTTPCWLRNPKITDFMKNMGFTTADQLTKYHFQRLHDIVLNLTQPRTSLMWQEAYDVYQPPVTDAIAHMWKGDTWQEYRDELLSLAQKGNRIIMSSCWYLNYIKYGADWKDKINSQAETQSRYYYCDPQDFKGTQEQLDKVIGGIVGMWGEFIDNTNLDVILWPRASAASERLWSPRDQTQDAELAWPRMHELRCRLVARGYSISPNNFPDYCPFEYDAKREYIPDNNDSTSPVPTQTVIASTTEASFSMFSFLPISATLLMSIYFLL